MKILKGTIRSVSSENTAVVEISRRVPHPVYGKLIKRRSIFKVDISGTSVVLGDEVRIVETRPISRDKNFKLYVDSNNKPQVAQKHKPSDIQAVNKKEAQKRDVKKISNLRKVKAKK